MTKRWSSTRSLDGQTKRQASKSTRRAMDRDLSDYIDQVQANEIAHTPWERKLADECDRLQFDGESADFAARRLGAKWKAATAEIARLKTALETTQRLAGRRGPSDQIQALNEIEVIAKSAR